MKLSPEVIEQLESMMDSGTNQDADIDYDQISDVMEQKLVPIFETLGQMLAAIEAKADSALELSQKIAEGIQGSVMGYQRNQLLDSITSKFGADIAPLDSLYSDITGKKFSDELIDKLMSGSDQIADQDGYIQSQIESAKSRYGKYLGMPASAEDDEEGPEEGEEGAEPVAGEISIEKVEKKKPTFEDMASMLGLKKGN